MGVHVEIGVEGPNDRRPQLLYYNLGAFLAHEQRRLLGGRNVSPMPQAPVRTGKSGSACAKLPKLSVYSFANYHQGYYLLIMIVRCAAPVGETNRSLRCEEGEQMCLKKPDIIVSVIRVTRLPHYRGSPAPCPRVPNPKKSAPGASFDEDRTVYQSSFVQSEVLMTFSCGAGSHLDRPSCGSDARGPAHTRRGQ